MKLANKLALAFLGVSILAIALIALLIWLRIGNASRDLQYGFIREQQVESLNDYYAENDAWPSRIGRGRGNPPEPFVVINEAGVIVASNERGKIGRRVPEKDLNTAIALAPKGVTIGYLLTSTDVRPNLNEQNPLQKRFLDSVQEILLVSALGAAGVALLAGALIARTVTKPLQELTEATRAVAQGDLDRVVTVRSDDEVGELATAFNQMNLDLAQSQALRRQMTADIAHDLRTPLSIIRGHAEGLRDGILPPEPATFNLIYDESLRLNRMIDDLRILSLAEAGELPLNQVALAPIMMLEKSIAAHRIPAQEKEVALVLEAETQLPDIFVDPDRMAQVLDNLIANALRHTPAGGTITIRVQPTNMQLQIDVADTGQGIAAEDLPNIFERFYRADRSRQRHQAGSGLGLSIVKSLIEQHGGTISVRSQWGQGTTITVLLPLSAPAIV